MWAVLLRPTAVFASESLMSAANSPLVAKTILSTTPSVIDLHFSAMPFDRVAELEPINLGNFEYLNCILGIAIYRGPKVTLRIGDTQYAIQRTELGEGLPNLMNEHVILSDVCPATSLANVRQFDLVFDRVQVTRISPAQAVDLSSAKKIVLRMFPQSGRVRVEEIIATDFVTIAQGKIRQYHP